MGTVSECYKSVLDVSLYYRTRLSFQTSEKKIAQNFQSIFPKSCDLLGPSTLKTTEF